MSRSIAVRTGPTWREVGLLAAGTLAVAASVAQITWILRNLGEEVTEALMTAYGSLMFTFVGVVVLWRRPGHGLGRLALLIGVLFAVSGGLSTGLDLWQPADGVRSVLLGPLKDAYDTLDAASTVLAVGGMIGGVVLLVAWFPDGRRTSRLGAVVEVTLAFGVAAVALTSLRDPILRQVGWSRNLEGALMAMDAISVLAILAAWVLAVVDLALRYRVATGARRTQMYVVLVAAAVSAALPILVILVGGVFPVLWALAIFGLGLPVLAIAISITRYHLYDIDRVVSRSIAYVAITVVLFAVFALVNLVVTQVVTRFLPDEARTVGVVISTLAVASLFQPLRLRVQLTVDRRFHRSRYDAQRTVDGFAARLRGQVDLRGLRSELQAAAMETVEPASTTVWLRQGPTA